VELGSGDGAGILAAARRSPTTFCVGIDTDAAAPREASSRAARPASKGGTPNAIFLAMDARALPAPFLGAIDELRIILPWGSLLRAVLSADPQIVTLIADGLRPGGSVSVVVSILPTDEHAIGAATSEGDLTALAASLERAGLQIRTPRAIEPEDLHELKSSWARRLGVPARRAATLLVAARPMGTGSASASPIDVLSTW
jgi:16S rRNA (adenine(1408)-N(1))-methyltransferase